MVVRGERKRVANARGFVSARRRNGRGHHEPGFVFVVDSQPSFVDRSLGVRALEVFVADTLGVERLVAKVFDDSPETIGAIVDKLATIDPATLALRASERENTDRRSPGCLDRAQAAREARDLRHLEARDSLVGLWSMGARVRATTKTRGPDVGFVVASRFWFDVFDAIAEAAWGE